MFTILLKDNWVLITELNTIEVHNRMGFCYPRNSATAMQPAQSSIQSLHLFYNHPRRQATVVMWESTLEGIRPLSPDTIKLLDVASIEKW